jgi:hypothetical protein
MVELGSGGGTPRDRIRRVVLAATCVLSATSLGGCVSHGSDDPQTWQEPAWFADQAREREEVKAVLQECMDSKGWGVPVDEYGGIDVNLVDLPDPQAIIDDMDECYKEIPSKYRVTIDASYLRNVLYGQQVDVYECLVAHGVTPEPPPPVDVFVETYLSNDPDESSDMWIPWGGDWTEKFFEDPANSGAALAALERECPQPYVAP